MSEEKGSVELCRKERPKITEERGQRTKTNNEV